MHWAQGLVRGECWCGAVDGLLPGIPTPVWAVYGTLDMPIEKKEQTYAAGAGVAFAVDDREMCRERSWTRDFASTIEKEPGVAAVDLHRSPVVALVVGAETRSLEALKAIL